MMIRHFLSDFQPLWTNEPVAKSCKMTFYTNYKIVPDMTGHCRISMIENLSKCQTILDSNNLKCFRLFFQIFSFHIWNEFYEWMTNGNTLYICHTFYVLRPMFTVFLVWHPLECERDDSSGGKSMWKRKGFENVEMASIHHDEDSPIHNIWSLHSSCCTVDPHISHTQFPTFCERATKTVPLQQLLTQASQ